MPDSPTTQAEKNRQRVARHAERQRERGLIRKYLWLHPGDWTKVEALVKRLNRARE